MTRDRTESLEKTGTAATHVAVQWRWPGAITAVLCTTWAVICLYAYYRPKALPFFSLEQWLVVWPPLIDVVVRTWERHLPPAGWFFGFVVGAGLVGRAGLRYFTRGMPLNALERWGFSYGLGAGIWGFLMFALSVAGLLRPAVVHLVFAGAVGLCWWLGRGPAPAEDLEASGICAGISLPLGAVTAVALVLTAAAALAPELFYDSLVYHLALPSLYTMEGAMVPTPTMVYSGIPMHMEMLYLWALIGGGPITAKLIHWSMGVGVSLAMVGFFARRGTAWAGWAACAIFISMPMAGFIFPRTFVDGGSAYFVLLAASALTLFAEQPDVTGRSRRLLVLAALFSGIAMATKYPNLPVFGAFLFALAASPRGSWRNVATFGLVATACVAPWLAKNAVYYRNPLFPFFQERWFAASTTPVNWRGLVADASGRDWGALLSEGGRPLWEAIAQPWVMTMKVKDEADFLGVLPLTLLPALLVLRPLSDGARLWLRLFWGVWLAWFMTTSMPRMFLPGLALLAMIGGLALAQVTKRWLRWTAGLAVLLVAVNNLFYVARGMQRTDMYSYLRGQTDTAGYLKVSHLGYPASDYASRDWINRQTPPTARVLVIGDARGFYLERPFLTASVFDTDPFWRTVDESASADEVYRRLRGRGFTHLLVNLGEIIRLKGRCPSKAPGSLERAEEFFRNHTRICFGEASSAAGDSRWSLVYVLVPSPEDASRNAVLVDHYRSQAAAASP